MEIRINKLIKKYNIGLREIVEFLWKQGANVDMNPNAKVSEMYIPALDLQFGKDLSMKEASDKADITVHEILGSHSNPNIPEAPADIKPIVHDTTNVDRSAHKQKTDQNNGSRKADAQEHKPNSTQESKKTNPVDDMDWGFFSALPPSSEVHDESLPDTTVRPDWETNLEAAIRAIPSPISDEEKDRILNLVSEWIDDATAEGDTADDEPGDEYSIEEIIARIEAREHGFLNYMFGNARKAGIQEKRAIVREILDSGRLVMNDFWHFIVKLLEIDEKIYRGPICESVYKYQDISLIYSEKENELIRVSELLFRDKRKCHQAIQFFYPFRKVLDKIVMNDIMDATQHLSTIEDLELAFNILGCDTHKKLYLLSVNESPASQYLGFSILKDYKNLNGIEAVRALKYFQTYMNCIYEYPSYKLINKIVLGDNSEMTDKEADELTREGFNSYLRYLQLAQGRASKKRLKDNIQEQVGKDAEFQFVGESKWNIFGSTRTGYGFILPKSWVAKEMTQGKWYHATVVKAVTNPNLLVLSQKGFMPKDISSISTVHEGEYVEARFTLFHDTINAEILGHGPTYARISTIPRNFDYKKKHTVKVISVRNVNKCDIVIAD